MTARRASALLSISVATEAAASASLKASDAFTHLVPSVGAVAGFVVSAALLGVLVNRLDVGLVYATWSGAGTALNAIIGVTVFDDPLSLASVSGMVMVVAGVVILQKPVRAEPAQTTPGPVGAESTPGNTASAAPTGSPIEGYPLARHRRQG